MSKLEECSGKHQFTTRNQALRVLKKIKSPGKINVYKCDHCQGYHIGSILGKKKKEKDHE